MSFSEALRIGMKIACGGDTGVFAHGQNALELILMRQLGAPWDCVLSWATYGGWKCVRGMEWEGGEGERRIWNVKNVQTSELLQDTILERGLPRQQESMLEMDGSVPQITKNCLWDLRLP